MSVCMFAGMPDVDSDPEGWMCVCGNWQDSDRHCSMCGCEPPWGCDCGMHEEYDAWNDEDPFPPSEE